MYPNSLIYLLIFVLLTYKPPDVKPFIFRFIDFKPTTPAIDEVVEYSKELNLNVLASTSIPAVEVLNIRGETFTKADQDPTDCLRNPLIRQLRNKLEEVTLTLSIEGTDKPKQFLMGNLIDYIKGKTITDSIEPTDTIRVRDFINLIRGMTHTREQLESTDIR